MLTYKAPLQDMLLLLDIFGYAEDVLPLEPFEGYDRSVIEAMLEMAADVTTKELLPLNPVGDAQGVSWDPETGEVSMPDGFHRAYKIMVEQGLLGITGPVEYGGSGGPEVLGILFSEMATATNKSFSMCPGLTRGLVDALIAHGTDEQKQEYLPHLVTGHWSGTMCLTEPQCGTDLGLIRTKAELKEDGTYSLTGTKIWITFGEHDMAENIIHSCSRACRMPPRASAASPRSSCQSLSMVKRTPSAAQAWKHKMGIKASPTCVMDMEGATGYLVGTPNKGMRSMFVMMNAARLHVGLEGIALGDIAYQTALAFAKERRQSRALDEGKQETSHEADTIMVHPDVRRMLLEIKSTNMAMRALGVWLAIEYDIAHYHADEARRQQAGDLVALLTPVIKSYGSERGFQNISTAMQICGGAGYTTDWHIEQYLRDERIAMIYEGTNHIQALDLVGRKLPMGGGRLVRLFSERITELLRECKGNEAMAEFTTPLKEVSKKLTEVTMGLAGAAMEDREVAGAVASPYLNFFALTSLAYIWTRIAKYTLDHPDVASGETYRKTARYFMQKVLPEYHALAHVIAAGKGNLMEFDVEEF